MLAGLLEDEGGVVFAPRYIHASVCLKFHSRPNSQQLHVRHVYSVLNKQTRIEHQKVVASDKAKLYLLLYRLMIHNLARIELMLHSDPF